MKLNLLMAGAVSAAMTASAPAATIERTFDVTASGFVFNPDEGPDTPAPIDPVDLTFTLIFDPSVAIAPTSEGLTINSFNLPYPLSYAADGTGELFIGTFPTSFGCDNEPASFCVIITNAGGPIPGGLVAFETTVTNGLWSTGNVTVTASAIEVVPEPSTWAMMLLGFMGLGYAGYRRAKRNSPAFAD
jgi:PEP-CTERM motif